MPGRSMTTITMTSRFPRADPEGLACSAGDSAASSGDGSGPGGAGRRRDRRQRPGHASDHRGVSAQRGPGRNPGLDRAVLEQVLADYLGVRNVIWLGRGIAGDDTHGHVDDLARFVDPQTIVTVVEPRTTIRTTSRSQENLRAARIRARPGRPAAGLSTLPMPAPGHLRWPATAGQLRQLLHRQRPRSGSHLQRPRRPHRAEHPGRALPRPPGRRHPLRRSRPWPGNAALHDAAAAQRGRSREMITLDFGRRPAPRLGRARLGS